MTDFDQADLGESSMVTSQPAAEEFVLERLHKLRLLDVGSSLPAGRLEPGETPQATALQKLIEETGHSAEGRPLLGSCLMNCIYGGDRAHLYYDANAPRTAAAHPNDLEQIEVQLLPAAQVARAQQRGETPPLSADAIPVPARLGGGP